MNEAFWLCLATLFTLFGMSWFALAMPVHWKQVHARGTGPNSPLLRAMGTAALLASALCCLQADHPSMAILVWIMLLAGAAFAVAMTLGRAPARLRGLSPAFCATPESA
ncbi:MAG: DUF3325 domain-containing protein [Gammaproteobacteria bacterium]|nr:DUF3325 domain-containing protein [Gammaproteobacteria bacterium]